ncbi:phosphoglucomutase/phosphomannomutase family protein [Candidatus Bipolaricaulota bacterium]|nr:phosphoglucomutase/phosphomannomutase family protein [Candidatus Bipolaricaulota bacterium]
MEEISFGTDGWRGVIADDYTYENLGRVAEATANYLKSPERRELEVYDQWGTTYRSADDGVVIGYDGRFSSENFALYVARVLEESGVPACVSQTMVPTPALSFAVREMEAAAGIMITASHNPPAYNGFKVKMESGASAPPVVTDRIEANLPDDSPDLDPGLEVERVDVTSSYVDALGEIVDQDMITKNPVMAVIDSMYGSAQGLTAEVLDRFGVQSVEVRDEFNPSFRGIRPEPLEEYLDPLKEAVAEQREEVDVPIIGVVTDGDGDRVSAMAEDSSFIDAHRTYALLMRYLIEEKEWEGKAVKNFPLTDMIFKIGQKHDRDVTETPVGFKFIAEKMVKEDVLIGGEESGGIGLKNHIPDRDGIFCSLMLIEMVARSGKQPTELVSDMMEEFGGHYYRRNDIHLEARREVEKQTMEDPPDRIGDFVVRKVETTDGAKLRFEDGWLLIRASGTEPLLRLYCEMDDMNKVDQVLSEAEKYARNLAGE